MVYQFFHLPSSATLADLEEAGQQFCNTPWSSVNAKRGAEIHVDRYCFRWGLSLTHLSCMYLAHHELDSVSTVMTAIVIRYCFRWACHLSCKCLAHELDSASVVIMIIVIVFIIRYRWAFSLTVLAVCWAVLLLCNGLWSIHIQIHTQALGLASHKLLAQLILVLKRQLSMRTSPVLGSRKGLYYTHCCAL